MTPKNDNIQEIINRMKEALNVTKDVELAKHLGGGQPSLWRKRGSVPFDACVSIAVEKNVSLDWLVLGRGVPEIGGDDEAGEASGYVAIPAFDMPGLPPNDGEVEAWWNVPRAWLDALGISPDDAMVMRVLGDASFDSIGHGDIVLLDRRPRDVDGVFALRFGDRVRIKRVQFISDGSVRLSNDNAAYEAEYIDAAAYAAIEVIGFCFAALGRVL